MKYNDEKGTWREIQCKERKRSVESSSQGFEEASSPRKDANAIATVDVEEQVALEAQVAMWFE